MVSPISFPTFRVFQTDQFKSIKSGVMKEIFSCTDKYSARAIGTRKSISDLVNLTNVYIKELPKKIEAQEKESGFWGRILNPIKKIFFTSVVNADIVCKSNSEQLFELEKWMDESRELVIEHRKPENQTVKFKEKIAEKYLQVLANRNNLIQKMYSEVIHSPNVPGKDEVLRKLQNEYKECLKQIALVVDDPLLKHAHELSLIANDPIGEGARIYRDVIESYLGFMDQEKKIDRKIEKIQTLEKGEDVDPLLIKAKTAEVQKFRLAYMKDVHKRLFGEWGQVDFLSEYARTEADQRVFKEIKQGLEDLVPCQSGITGKQAVKKKEEELKNEYQNLKEEFSLKTLKKELNVSDGLFIFAETFHQSGSKASHKFERSLKKMQKAHAKIILYEYKLGKLGKKILKEGAEPLALQKAKLEYKIQKKKIELNHYETLLLDEIHKELLIELSKTSVRGEELEKIKEMLQEIITVQKNIAEDSEELQLDFSKAKRLLKIAKGDSEFDKMIKGEGSWNYSNLVNVLTKTKPLSEFNLPHDQLVGIHEKDKSLDKTFKESVKNTKKEIKKIKKELKAAKSERKEIEKNQSTSTKAADKAALNKQDMKIREIDMRLAFQQKKIYRTFLDKMLGKVKTLQFSVRTLNTHVADENRKMNELEHKLAYRGYRLQMLMPSDVRKRIDQEMVPFESPNERREYLEKAIRGYEEKIAEKKEESDQKLAKKLIRLEHKLQDILTGGSLEYLDEKGGQNKKASRIMDAMSKIKEKEEKVFAKRVQADKLNLQYLKYKLLTLSNPTPPFTKADMEKREEFRTEVSEPFLRSLGKNFDHLSPFEQKEKLDIEVKKIDLKRREDPPPGDTQLQEMDAAKSYCKLLLGQLPKSPVGKDMDTDLAEDLEVKFKELPSDRERVDLLLGGMIELEENLRVSTRTREMKEQAVAKAQMQLGVLDKAFNTKLEEYSKVWVREDASFLKKIKGKALDYATFGLLPEDIAPSPDEYLIEKRYADLGVEVSIGAVKEYITDLFARHETNDLATAVWNEAVRFQTWAVKHPKMASGLAANIALLIAVVDNKSKAQQFALTLKADVFTKALLYQASSENLEFAPKEEYRDFYFLAKLAEYGDHLGTLKQATSGAKKVYDTAKTGGVTGALMEAGEQLVKVGANRAYRKEMKKFVRSISFENARLALKYTDIIKKVFSERQYFDTLLNDKKINKAQIIGKYYKIFNNPLGKLAFAVKDWIQTVRYSQTPLEMLIRLSPAGAATGATTTIGLGLFFVGTPFVGIGLVILSAVGTYPFLVYPKIAAELDKGFGNLIFGNTRKLILEKEAEKLYTAVYGEDVEAYRAKQINQFTGGGVLPKRIDISESETENLRSKFVRGVLSEMEESYFTQLRDELEVGASERSIDGTVRCLREKVGIQLEHSIEKFIENLEAHDQLKEDKEMKLSKDQREILAKEMAGKVYDRLLDEWFAPNIDGRLKNEILKEILEGGPDYYKTLIGMSKKKMEVVEEVQPQKTQKSVFKSFVKNLFKQDKDLAKKAAWGQAEQYFDSYYSLMLDMGA